MRGAILGLGVVACVAAAVWTAATRLNDALGFFDVRADANSSSTYSERAHTHAEWSPASGTVLETARLWMPADARYRVVFGPGFDPVRSPDFTHHFLYGFLLPRQPTRDQSSEWAFCFGCSPGMLGDRYEVLAGGEGWLTFGRLAP
jgi:hypothetical protein